MPGNAMMHAPSALYMVAAFVLLLGPLVLFHELGHYCVGRMFGIGARVFSIGFGREIVGWTDKRGTRWKVSILPLGGYVQFVGDLNAMSQPGEAVLTPEDEARAFHNKPLWQRALVVLAGPLANFLIAVIIFTAFNLAFGRMEASPVVAEFANPSPAQAAGMHVGDRIVAVDGSEITRFDQIRSDVLPVPGETLAITVLRAGRRVTLPVTVGTRIDRDEFGNESRVGQLGIKAGAIEIIHVGPVQAVGLAVDQCFGMVGNMVTGIRQIATGERSAKELGGPVKIARYSGERLALGWQEFVYFAGLISINLAFINILPIPMLDGGHLLFYAAEAVRRKPLGQRSQEWAFRTGLAFVLALMLFVTINDIASLHILGG